MYNVNYAIGDLFSTHWRNESKTWQAFCEIFAKTHRLKCTVRQLHAMNKDQQTRQKNKRGAFVGGWLKEDNGPRDNRNMHNRQLITIDCDKCPPGYDPLADFKKAYPHTAALIHTTAKHTPEAPRYRMIIPLAMPVAPIEAERLTGWIIRQMGDNAVKAADSKTTEPARCMFFPCCPLDGEYIYNKVDGEPLMGRWLLEQIPTDYQDMTFHLQAPDQAYSGSLADPRTKSGVIGAFCRCFDIHGAKAAFLGDVYERVGANRYTYLNGTSWGGLIVYDGGMYAYSNHSTDPANTGHCLNAFDLVRLHQFGQDDTSYIQMVQWAEDLPAVRQIMDVQKHNEIMNDYTDIAEDLTDWRDAIRRNKNGSALTTPDNLYLIGVNDPEIHMVKYDEFQRRDITDNERFTGCNGGLVTDESLMKIARYLCEKYEGKFTKDNVADLLTATQKERAFHPVKEYIESEPWDGVKRLDEVLIKYLGADDTPLVRAMTRKWFTAAVRRVYEPGCKFDNMLVLAGPQGCGKSTLLAMIAGERGQYFDESVSFEMDEKQLTEHLTSAWILEFAELNGLKTARGESQAKAWMSKTKDQHRAAYHRTLEVHPRHCVFAGTTNERAFLNDLSSRKFWVVDCQSTRTPAEWADEFAEDIPQLWAEAYHYHIAGEHLFLKPELERQIREIQAAHNQVMDDPLLGLLRQFLDTPVPDGWYQRSATMRREYFSGSAFPEKKVPTRCRPYVSTAEIRNEMPGADKVDPRYIVKLMDATPGWQRAPHRRTVAGYGKQTVYDRVSASLDTHLDI